MGNGKRDATAEMALLLTVIDGTIDRSGNSPQRPSRQPVDKRFRRWPPDRLEVQSLHPISPDARVSCHRGRWLDSGWM